MDNALRDLFQAIGYFIIGSAFGILLAIVYMLRTGGI